MDTSHAVELESAAAKNELSAVIHCGHPRLLSAVPVNLEQILVEIEDESNR